MSEATLTLEEMGELMAYFRDNRGTTIQQTGPGLVIARLKDGNLTVAMHPRTLLEIIRSETTLEGERG